MATNCEHACAYFIALIILLSDIHGIVVGDGAYMKWKEEDQTVENV